MIKQNQTHGADRRLRASVWAVISSMTTLSDFPSLNYHLALTSGAPQRHKQTAISTCPHRGHKTEETHLNKTHRPKKDGREIHISLNHVLFAHYTYHWNNNYNDILCTRQSSFVYIWPFRWRKHWTGTLFVSSNIGIYLWYLPLH